MLSPFGTTNCNFTNNSAGYGGAIHFFTNGIVKICNFANNSAGYGGAIHFDLEGTVEHCNFTNNKATGDDGYGGAIYFEDAGTVINCSFIDNTATGDYGQGGAIYFNREGTVINCSFIDNTATATYEGGGAICMGSGSVINCSFIDNTATGDEGRGGAIYFYENGDVSNCNFANNKVTGDDGYGGAIYFNRDGTVINCNFANNKVTGDGGFGGAIYFYRGTVISCNFTNNQVGDYGDGGAIYFYENGNVSICNFVNNRAGGCGAISNMGHVVADTCIFKTDSDSAFQVQIIPPTLNVDNFTTSYNSGEKLTFNLTTNSGIPIYNRKILIEVYDKNNDDWVGDYSCLSGEGWTVNLPAGLYYAVFDTEYDEFEQVYITLTISRGNSSLNVGDVTLDYGTSTSVTVTTEGASGITAKIDDENTTVEGYAVMIPVLNAGNHTLTVTTIPDGNHISVTKTVNLTVNKVNSTLIINNIILDYGENTNVSVTAGGATRITATIDNDPVDVINNYTIPISDFAAGNYTLTVTTIADANHINITKTVNVIVNKVDSTLTVHNIEFDYNTSGSTEVSFTGATGVIAKVIDYEGAIVEVNGNTITVSNLAAGNYNLTVTTIADDNHNNITKTAEISVNKANSTLTINNMVFDYEGIGSTSVSFINATGVVAEVIGHDEATVNVDGNMIYVSSLDADSYKLRVTTIPDNNHNSVTVIANITVNRINSTIDIPEAIEYGADVAVTAEGAVNITAEINGEDVPVNGFIIPMSGFNADNYTLTVATIPDANHYPVIKTVNITVMKANSTITINDITFDYNSNGSAEVSFTGATGINAKVIDHGEAVVNVTGNTITVSNLNAGEYQLEVTTIADENHNNMTKTVKITVNKLKTQLTTSAITTTYNVNKYLLITLKDSKGKALSGVSATVNLNGAKTYITNKNGQIKVNVAKLVPKAYAAKITFNGNANYIGSAKSVKVTAKKATPKLTAKAKTFKVKDKTKKYTITLKDNKNKAIKSTKVTIKVSGKTYSAKTNSKGVATFKLTKLVKKGTFAAVVKFAGNKYYNSAKQNVKIKVKWGGFKTFYSYFFNSNPNLFFGVVSSIQEIPLIIQLFSHFWLFFSYKSYIFICLLIDF